jgi:hypothetical protein
MGTQRRRAGEFTSKYSDEQLYMLIREVAASACDGEADQLSQPLFDQRAPAVAKALELPPPPTARAIYMRFKKKRIDTSWPKLVAAAVGAVSVTQQVAADNSAQEVGPWLDERGIVFALRYAARTANAPTLTDYQYDALRIDLLRNAVAALVMPTAAQIKTIAGDWPTALALAGMKAPKTDLRATPIARLAWHYYEAKEKLPTETTLREYCNHELEVAMPRGKDHPWAEYLEELRALRAERGWSTPPAGPAVDERLTDTELAELLAGARPATKRGAWTEERVRAAFVEFAEMFHGRQELTLRLYKAHAPANGWPGSSTYAKYGSFTALKKRAVSLRALRSDQAA